MILLMVVFLLGIFFEASDKLVASNAGLLLVGRCKRFEDGALPFRAALLLGAVRFVLLCYLAQTKLLLRLDLLSFRGAPVIGEHGCCSFLLIVVWSGALLQSNGCKSRLWGGQPGSAGSFC